MSTTGDEFDHLRKQMNTIIVDRMQDGKNGIQKDKYLTVAVHTDKDEHLFETTLTVTIFADSEEQLDEYTETLITEYKKASVVIETMTDQQEEGFNSTLPLCYNQVACKRTLKSSSAAIFVPFSTLELNEPNRINYSCNLLSKNLLVYDRLLSSNFNGFILGTPGAGKSFSAKIEMLSVFLKTNSDIIVIDPEDEYTALAKLLGGEIIKIVPGGENHINPLEMVHLMLLVSKQMSEQRSGSSYIR